MVRGYINLKLILISLTFSFLSSICSAQNDDVLKFYNSNLTVYDLNKNQASNLFEYYKKSYWEAESDCFGRKYKGTGAFIEIQNCIWDKDKINLRMHKLNSILYESSYSRYSRLFNDAKVASIEMIGGSFSDSDIYNYTIKQTHTMKDSFKLQRMIFMEALGF